jgi:energy-coupling factor transporter ATP-binding protein EcfA2
MLKRITLHNFMSHSHTVIDLSPGLTVLTGPNNCGKSAFVSALQNLTENTKGNYMIRHGAKECRVIVETDDGHTIEWKRKKKNASYCIDGIDIHRKTPDQLDEILRLSKVKAGDSDEFDVHFGEQKSPIFLLGEPGSRAARFFASSSDASKLIEMQKLHRSNVQSAQQELKWQQAQEKQNAEILGLLSPIPDLETRLEKLDQTFQTLSKEQQQLQHLDSMIRELSRASDDVSRLLQQVGCLSELPAELEQENEKPLEKLVDYWLASERSVKELQASTQRLDALAEPPLIEDEVPLESLVRNMLSQLEITQRSTETQRCLEKLPDPPKLTDSQELEKLIDQLSFTEEREQRHREQVAILTECHALPQLIEEDVLTQLCQQWESAEAEKQQRQQIYEQAAADHHRVREALQRWAEENPTCPTCGEELKPDRFIQNAETGLKGHIHGT